MSISLTAVATALTTVSAAIKASEIIFEAGAQLVQVAESAYTTTAGSGASKKVAVLAGLKAFVEHLGENWDELKAELSDWIDMVIQTWNNLKAISPVGKNSATA